MQVFVGKPTRADKGVPQAMDGLQKLSRRCVGDYVLTKMLAVKAVQRFANMPRAEI
jgi:hypothetical protein